MRVPQHILAGHQPSDLADARPRGTAGAARPRRRGDRIERHFAASAHGRLWHEAVDAGCPLNGGDRVISGQHMLIVSSSHFDPTVWTGRALQAESDDLEVIGLALLYPALERNVCVPGHHGYPHASDLILGKALKGRSGHQFRDATARPFLHLLIPARRPRRESRLMLLGSA